MVNSRELEVIQAFRSDHNMSCDVHGKSSLTLCTFMADNRKDGFIYGVVVSVYPFLLQDKNIAAADKVQLYTSVLTAAFPISDLITAPICAFYVDHYHSRRVPWLIGLIGMVAGIVAFGVSDSFAALLISRLLQGASSAILYTVGLAVLVESVEKSEVGTYMGSAMSCNNFGIIMSPLLGGVLYETRGQMAVLGIMVAILGIDITMRLLMVDKSNAGKSLDTEKVGTSMEAVHLGVLHIDENSEKLPSVGLKVVDESSMCSTSDTDSLKLSNTLSKLASGASSIVVTDKPVRISTGGRFRGVLRLIRSPRLLAALYGCFINECIVASLCAVLPLFVERSFHWTSLQAGCLFLTIAIPGLAGSLAGMLADRVGARWVSVAGFLLTAPSLIAMMAVKRDETAHIALLCVLLTTAGSTIIFFLAPLGADLSHVADALSEELEMDLFASSFSLMNMALASAGVIGPLFIGWLQDEVGWTGTCTAMGVLCVSGAIPCVSVGS